MVLVKRPCCYSAWRRDELPTDPSWGGDGDREPKRRCSWSRSLAFDSNLTEHAENDAALEDLSLTNAPGISLYGRHNLRLSEMTFSPLHSLPLRLTEVTICEEMSCLSEVCALPLLSQFFLQTQTLWEYNVFILMPNDLEENILTTDTFSFLHFKIMTRFTESVMQKACKKHPFLIIMH